MQWRVKLYKLDFLLYEEVGFAIKININVEDTTAGAFHSDLLRAAVINQRLCVLSLSQNFKCSQCLIFLLYFRVRPHAVIHVQRVITALVSSRWTVCSGQSQSFGLAWHYSRPSFAFLDRPLLRLGSCGQFLEIPQSSWVSRQSTGVPLPQMCPSLFYILAFHTCLS